MPVLIEQADYCVRDADRVERNVDVLIVGDRISAVGHIAREGQGHLEVIDGRGRAVMPGLVNAHAHLYQNFLKGLRDDVGLVEWCDATLYPMAHAIHDEQRKQGIETAGYHWGALSAMEMFHSGVTCCVDMNMNMDSVFEAWQQVGLRGVGAIAVSDRWIPDVLRRTPETTRREARQLAAKWAHTHPRIQVVLAPSTPFLCSRELLEWARDTAADLDVGLQIHLCETRYEIENVKRETGQTPIVYVHGLGILGPRTMAVHCVHIADEEIDLLAATNTTAVHCPKSNLKLGSGIAPVPRMLARGVTVALATDGAASNDTLDMFEETRMAALLHKGVAGDPTVMTARQAFRMATQGGARAVGIDAGTIDPGKLADVVLVNMERAHLVPVHDVVNTLVYCAKASDVETTIIGGQIVMRNGLVTTVDEEQVIQAARAYGGAMYERGVKAWNEVRKA